MKMPTFATVMRAWVGDRRLADAAAVLGIGVSTLSMQLRGGHVPWDLQVRRLAPLIGWEADKLAAIADRDREAIDRAKALQAADRKPRASTSAPKKRQRKLRKGAA